MTIVVDACLVADPPTLPRRQERRPARQGVRLPIGHEAVEPDSRKSSPSGERTGGQDRGDGNPKGNIM